MAPRRHKRDTDARPLVRIPRAPFVAGPLAVAATLSVVGLGVWTAEPETRDLLVASGRASVAPVTDLPARPQVVSRSQGRIQREEPWEDLLAEKAVARAIRTADTRLWTTAPLNLWSTPGDDAAKRGVVDEGRKVLVTGREAAGRTEVVLDGRARWVTAGYLTDENPNQARTRTRPAASPAPEAADATGAVCTNGSSVSSGVSPNVVAVHAAVCANFPELTSYGTFRGDGEHAQGLAIDVMVSGSRGWEVAEFVRANYSELGVSYIIYAQKIWSVDRAGEGWRSMEDRGSVTANHYDHVHVTTY